MRVGLFGGSFDPIHNAHLKLASAALRKLKLDRVYFVVSPLSPFKTGKSLTPAPARLALVRAALKNNPEFRAASWEMKRRGPSYTITTVRDYQRAHPTHELFLILGTDALAGFPRWKKPEDLAKRVTLVAGRRPGTAWPGLADTYRARVIRLPGTFPDISSTEIRARLAKGRRSAVPSAVAVLIHRKGLYR